MWVCDVHLPFVVHLVRLEVNVDFCQMLFIYILEDALGFNWATPLDIQHARSLLCPTMQLLFIQKCIFKETTRLQIEQIRTFDCLEIILFIRVLLETGEKRLFPFPPPQAFWYKFH